MNDEKEIILLKEGALQSVLSDIFMWASLLFAFWFNLKFIEGNNFLDAIIFILFFVGMLSRTNTKAKRFHRKEDLIDYLYAERNDL